VLAAVLFGAWGLGLLPGQASVPSLGLVPVEAWLLAGLLYLILATISGRLPGGRGLLGFARRPDGGRTCRAPHRAGGDRGNGPMTSAQELLEAVRRDVHERGGEPARAADRRRSSSTVDDRRARGRGAADRGERPGAASCSWRRARRAERVRLPRLAGPGRGLALATLPALTRACGMDEAAVAAYRPHPGCQSYPAYLAWLALNGEPAEVILALMVNFAAWGGYCRTVAAALREHYGFGDEACGFFDFFATGAPEMEQQALAAIRPPWTGAQTCARPAVRAPVAVLRDELLEHLGGQRDGCVNERVGRLALFDQRQPTDLLLVQVEEESSTGPGRTGYRARTKFVAGVPRSAPAGTVGRAHRRPRVATAMILASMRMSVPASLSGYPLPSKRSWCWRITSATPAKPGTRRASRAP
jgi:hypothetical protein